MKTIQYFYNSDREKAHLMVADAVIATRRSPSTVYMWMRGERIPCFLEKVCLQKLVEKHFGERVPLEELFNSAQS